MSAQREQEAAAARALLVRLVAQHAATRSAAERAVSQLHAVRAERDDAVADLGSSVTREGRDGSDGELRARARDALARLRALEGARDELEGELARLRGEAEGLRASVTSSR